ncbi:hypothetical protein Tco_1353189 [Tanacetum coccineum]
MANGHEDTLKIQDQAVETMSGKVVTTSGLQRDAVWNIYDAKSDKMANEHEDTLKIQDQAVETTSGKVVTTSGLQRGIFYDHVNPITRQTIDQAASGKLREKNDEESWALLEDLALYDNESWNDLRDSTKQVKAISMPQDVPSTSDRLVLTTLNIAWKIPSKLLLIMRPRETMEWEVNRETT